MNRVKNRRHTGQVELILQSCPSENGAAALAMVLSYYGRPAAMRDLSGRTIASAADLISAARSRGVYAQGYQMSFPELCQAPMPLIAHWKFRSFVVVTGLRGGKVCVNSPEEGYLILSRKEFEAGFTGVAVCFAAGDEPERQHSDRPVHELLSGEPAVPVLLAAAQLFIAAGYAALSVLLRSVAARLSAPQTGGSLLCVELGLVLLLQGAAVTFQIWLIRRCRTLHEARNIHEFQRRLDHEGASFFRQTHLLRLEEAASGCVERPSAMARSTVCAAQLAGGGLCLAVMAVQDLAAAAAAALAAAGFCGVCLLRRERLYSDGKLRSREAFLTEELAQRDLSAWEDHRLRGEDGACFQTWAGEAGGAFRPAELDRQREFWYIAAAVELLLVFCVCLLEMIAGWAGTADLLSCTVLAAAAAASLGALPCLLEEQAASRRFRESAGQLFQGEPESAVPSGFGTAKTLTVQNVSLRPGPDGKTPARDLTFTVRRGEILVVTADAEVRAALAAMVSSLERPARGELYLDNRNAADLSDREVCGNITLLGGGVPFPRGTVRENIAAGFRNLTDYAVMEAASNALLHESILLRESGYDTPVDTLSAGERLLLEFARAFARGTPFLVCDGLTGILDRETEDRLIRNLRRRGIGAVLLTEDRALVHKGDIAFRVEGGRTALRERAEFVEGEVDCLV